MNVILGEVGPFPMLYQRQLGHAQLGAAVGIQLHGFSLGQRDQTLRYLGADRRISVLQTPRDPFCLRLQDNGRILRAEGNIGNIPLFKLEEGGGIGVVPGRGGGILVITVGEFPLYAVPFKFQHPLFIGDGQGEHQGAALYALQIMASRSPPPAAPRARKAAEATSPPEADGTARPSESSLAVPFSSVRAWFC